MENSPMASALIKVENFSYRYKGSQKYALANLSFAVEEFECCGIIGPSEAGKTTLALALSAVLPHYFSGGWKEGNVVVDGSDAFTTPLEKMTRKVGFLPQNSNIYLTGIKPTVREEIAFSMENLGFDRGLMVQRVEDLMREVGISHLADRDPLELSGGETQRLTLACVLALDPPVLILDEPTLSLDPEGIRALSALLRRLKGRKTLLIVEQHHEIFPRLVDSILVMDQGRKVYRGSPREFFAGGFSFEREVGAPVWTELYYELSRRAGRSLASFPYTYREALGKLTELT